MSNCILDALCDALKKQSATVIICIPSETSAPGAGGEVAALSAVVAALFATTANTDAQGDPARLIDYAAQIAASGGADPEAISDIAERIVAQASGVTHA
jgi:hypothetical protein